MWKKNGEVYVKKEKKNTENGQWGQKRSLRGWKRNLLIKDWRVEVISLASKKKGKEKNDPTNDRWIGML